MPTDSHRHPQGTRARASFAAAILVLSLLSAREVAAQHRPTSEPTGARPRAGVGRCDTSWSSPRELRTASGLRVYVEAPFKVPAADGTYLIGAPTFVWATPDAFVAPDSKRFKTAAGVRRLEDLAASPLPPLPGDRAPYMPVAVRRGSRLLTLWGTSSDSTITGVFHQDTLWEATLDSDRWSAPRAVWSTGEFAWRPGGASHHANDSSVVVAFPAMDSSRTPRYGITVLWRSRDGWRSRWIGVGRLPILAVASILVSESELLVAAVGAIDRPTIRALNAVYTVRVRLDDTASAPGFALVGDFRQSPVDDPSVFRTADGLHVAWRRPGRGGVVHDSLVEATSRDQGATWQVTSAVSLEGDMRGLRVLPLDGGDALAMALDIRTQTIATLRRSSATWHLTHEKFANAKTIPMITALHDRLELSFGQTRSSAGPDGAYDAPVLVTSTRARRCETTSGTHARKRLRAPPRGKSTPR